jgi:fucose permease
MACTPGGNVASGARRLGWRGRCLPTVARPPAGPTTSRWVGVSAGPVESGACGRWRRHSPFAGGFVVLGLADGALGAAWPAIHADLALPLADLGLLLIAGTVGVVSTSVLAGRAVDRTPAGRLAAGGAGLLALGALLLASSTGLAQLVVGAVLAGAGSGAIDGSLNTVLARAGRHRLLNLLHGAYGVGTMLGPLAVAVALLAGSWRGAYGLLVLVDLGVGAALCEAGWVSSPAAGGARRPAGRGRAGAPTDVSAGVAEETKDDHRTRDAWVAVAGGDEPGHRRGRLGLVLALLAVAMFVAYTGLEVSAGQWAATFAHGVLGLSAASAAASAFGFWSGLAGVRLLLGIRRQPPGPRPVVGVGLVVAALGIGLLWWRPDLVVALAGLVVLGGALAGMFPALLVLTGARLGGERAGRLTGFQIAGAAVGGSGLSALVGVVLASAGVSAYPLAETVLLLAVIGSVGGFDLASGPAREALRR